MSDTPQYAHDRECCTFLGRWRGVWVETAGDYDLYYCAANPDVFPTVIARYGHDGPEYTSGMAFVNRMAVYTAPGSPRDGQWVWQCPPLDEAFRRALARGIVDRERVLAHFPHLAPLFESDPPPQPDAVVPR